MRRAKCRASAEEGGRSRRGLRGRWRAACLIAGCAMAVAGCSSSQAPKTTTKNTVVVTPGSSVPYNVADNARDDVKVGSCSRIADAWVLHGTVMNPTKSPASFEIVVDYVSQPNSTVLATTVVNVRAVAPGVTTAWSATGAKGQSAVACIVRQAQTT